MKLAEMLFDGLEQDDYVLESLVYKSLNIPERDTIRVEIHSIDDQPAWSETPPKGWGVGWWVRCVPGDKLEGIVIRRIPGDPNCIEVLANGPLGWGVYSRADYNITAYGPRVEVPR
ncbi:hypothetical protein EBZ39_02990 [bacterium]|nr:hypothetical protein [bacterium]